MLGDPFESAVFDARERVDEVMIKDRRAREVGARRDHRLVQIEPCNLSIHTGAAPDAIPCARLPGGEARDCLRRVDRLRTRRAVLAISATRAGEAFSLAALAMFQAPAENPFRESP